MNVTFKQAQRRQAEKEKSALHHCLDAVMNRASMSTCPTSFVYVNIDLHEGVSSMRLHTAADGEMQECNESHLEDKKLELATPGFDPGTSGL